MEAVAITEKGKKNFGDRLRKFREEKGWSLQVASDVVYKRTGRRFSRSTLGDIENATVKQIKPDTLLLIAQSGLGDMSFSEMMNVLTENRMALCEKGVYYDTSANKNERKLTPA